MTVDNFVVTDEVVVEQGVVRDMMLGGEKWRQGSIYISERKELVILVYLTSVPRLALGMKCDLS